MLYIEIKKNTLLYYKNSIFHEHTMLRKPAFRVESVILTRTANSFCLKATSKLCICLRYIWFQQCIRSFVYSFTRLFIFSSTHAFIQVIVQTCIHLLHYSIRSIMHVFIHSWIRLSHYSLLAFNQQFVNYVCSFIRSFVHFSFSRAISYGQHTNHLIWGFKLPCYETIPMSKKTTTYFHRNTINKIILAF